MKKILIFLTFALCISGCNKNENNTPNTNNGNNANNNNSEVTNNPNGEATNNQNNTVDPNIENPAGLTTPEESEKNNKIIPTSFGAASAVDWANNETLKVVPKITFGTLNGANVKDGCVELSYTTVDQTGISNYLTSLTNTNEYTGNVGGVTENDYILYTVSSEKTDKKIRIYHYSNKNSAIVIISKRAYFKEINEEVKNEGSN